jgi:DNA polymerase-4
MKLLCVLLPHFPLRCDIQRHTATDRPTIVLQTKDESGSQKTVLDFSPELERLQPGMALQPALSMYGEVALIQADIPYYWSIFNGIMDQLEEISPLVEGHELGCVYIGLDGLQLLYQSDEALANAIKEVIPEMFKAKTGIAEGKFLAYLMALYSHSDESWRSQTTKNPSYGKRILRSAQNDTRGSSADVATFLKDLPCDVLPISARAKGKLQDYGIRTLGQLSCLAQGPLQAQFGPEGKRILELAKGYDDTPLYPRSLEETIEDSTTLPSVTVSLETVQAAMEVLLSRTFAKDILKGRGIRTLTLWTRGWNGEQWEKSLQFKEPAMETKSATSRIKLVLESYPQPGPVEQLGIRITRLGYGDGRQRSLFSEVRAKDHLMEDIRQLSLRLGDHQVFKVKEVEPWSRIPERRYALTPLN